MDAPRPSRLRRIRRIVIFLAANALLTLLIISAAVVFIWWTIASALPEPRPWHLISPASEFTADDAAPGYTLDDYLANEQRIFDELSTLLRTEWSDDASTFSRFRLDAPSNPDRAADRNWNRSLLLESEDPLGAALLIHGLSDSPYSLRRIGLDLHERGWTVLWLRVPGHGTAPAALAESSRRDWIAAVRIAARDLRTKLPDTAPLALFGFSNGGALSVEYAAASLDDPELPRPDALVLFSPMIGITPLARITQLYPLVGRISGLEQVAWSRFEAEIDPYKYSSWPMNASVQAWRLTQQVESALARLDRRGRMNEFPPTLTFQSAVDSTVLIPRLVDRFYARLEDSASELIIFDVNEMGVAEGLLKSDYREPFESLLERRDLPFSLRVITNTSPTSPEVHEWRRVKGEVVTTPLDQRWPDDVFSLSHGAVPIPEDDPILGLERVARDGDLALGALNLRGETGVLRISESLMLRLRCNPFFDYLERRTFDWLADHVVATESDAAPPG